MSDGTNFVTEKSSELGQFSDCLIRHKRLLAKLVACVLQRARLGAHADSLVTGLDVLDIGRYTENKTTVAHPGASLAATAPIGTSSAHAGLATICKTFTGRFRSC